MQFSNSLKTSEYSHEDLFKLQQNNTKLVGEILLKIEQGK